MKLYLQQPFQTSYSIRAQDPELIRRLQLKFGMYLRESEEPAQVQINVSGQPDGRFLVTSGDTAVHSAHPLQCIDALIHESIRYDDSILALHGSAVAWQGQAYLFLAPTTTGKTTLASYLVARGFGYISEDCIPVDRTHLTVHPCTAPIHLRVGGMEVLCKLGCAPENAVEFDDTAQMRYAFTPENRVSVPLPIGGILFIRRTDAENSVTPLPVNERICELMRSPITEYPVNGDYLRLLTRIASKNCLCVRYCDMDYVAEVIRNG